MSWPCHEKRVFNEIKKQTLWPLFMGGVQLSQGYRATTRILLILTIQFPGVPVT